MLDILKNALFTGVGLAGLTKETLENLASEFARNANLGLKEAGDLRVELMEKAAESRQQLQAEIDHRIDHSLIQVGLAKAGVKRAVGNAGDQLQQVVDARLDAALQRLGVARSADLGELAARVDFLEKKLAAK